MSYSVFIFFNTQSLESGICSRVTEHLNSNTKFCQKYLTCTYISKNLLLKK